MDLALPAGLIPVLLLVLAAEFVNGWTDAPNAIATVVSTRVLTPSVAVVMATGLNILGAMSGTALAAVRGLPTSESHALVAALAGASLATAGRGVLLWDGWRKVLIGLGFSSILGFLGGFAIMVAISWIFRRVPLAAVRRLFGRLQILSAAFMGFSHGSNDGQKFIGVFTLALVLGGVLPEFRI